MKGTPEETVDIAEDQSLVDYYADRRNLKNASGLKSCWNYMESFLEENGWEFEEITEERALEFCEYLKQSNSLNQETAEHYVIDLATMVDWYRDRGRYDYNPFHLALDEDPFEYDKNTLKREITLQELRNAVNGVNYPPLLVIVILLLKTGLRLSEAANLDYRAINLDHPISELMPDPRLEIVDKPDTIFVDSSITAGQEHNGERRTCSNKEKSYRAIPIDEELKEVLVWWISMSPPSSSPAEPLLRKTRAQAGDRFSDKRIWDMFVEWAQKNGWHEWEEKGNVTPHWCRHWFTTMLRKRIDQSEVELGTVKGYVEGLRGDSEEGVIEIYTHDWGDQEWMREAYTNNIPKFFLDD